MMDIVVAISTKPISFSKRKLLLSSIDFIKMRICPRNIYIVVDVIFLRFSDIRDLIWLNHNWVVWNEGTHSNRCNVKVSSVSSRMDHHCLTREDLWNLVSVLEPQLYRCWWFSFLWYNASTVSSNWNLLWTDRETFHYCSARKTRTSSYFYWTLISENESFASMRLTGFETIWYIYLYSPALPCDISW